ncbi:hypothetical protein TWF106_011350 [Orbilia oligospora]|uniref:Uncharacterized protein n=1 Tax=Orbilia oligospora TaxID=2813651 RepID=A0A7C8QDP0_ORBOL|nr:hypothetical protein TWF106_011350 [Orbilia oligospora]KAF3214188.1 hypothetical protein TWF679_005054 [Orbilia oligospora]
MNISISRSITHILQIDHSKFLTMQVLASHPPDPRSGPEMSIPTIGPTTNNVQDLSAKTLDEMRRRFLTECQIISSITTASALQLKYEALQELFHLNLNSRSLDIYHPATNGLLDNLALLLDKGRCEDSVAVAFTAYTGKSIRLVIQLGQSSLNEKCRHRDPVEVIRHVERVFYFIHLYHDCSPGGRYYRKDILDPRKDIWIDFASYQLEQSFEKLHRRFPHLQIFCQEARSFTLPFRVSITKSSDIDDAYHIPSVDVECSHVLVELYREYLNSLNFYGRSISPSKKSMMRLTPDNFGKWSTVFTWYFGKLENSLHGFDKSKVDFKEVAKRLTTLAGLVSNSQLFRDWFSIISRGIAKKRARRKYEAAVGRTKVPNFSRPLGPKYNHERKPGITDSPPERSITKALKLPLVPKGIRKIFVELKTRKEELEALRARSEQESSSPQLGENSPDSEDPEGYSDIEGDTDEEFSMIQDIASPGTVENISFKRVSLIAQTLFLTKEVLDSRHLHRYMKGKNPEITVLSSINHAETTEFECENLKRTCSWLLPQHYGPGNQNREVTVKNFISSMKESLASRPAKAQQLTRIVKDTPEHPRIFVPQHPELSLLSYLARQNNAGDYPYPYIGLAKPPCIVCGIVLLGSKSYSAMGANPESPCSCITSVPTDLPALAQGLIYSSIERLAEKVSRSFNQERIIASYRG